MARKASSTTKPRSASGGQSGSKPRSAPAKAVATRSRAGDERGFDATDAFLKLLQSPLVADLLAVAATAALAALAEHGFNRNGGDSRRAGRAVKAAGKAAATAIGRRLANEVDEIRQAAKNAKAGAAA